jgi:hypothetical protein
MFLEELPADYISDYTPKAATLNFTLDVKHISHGGTTGMTYISIAN